MSEFGEWTKEYNKMSKEINEGVASATTPSETLPWVLRGLAMAARNYTAVVKHGGDEFGASAEDAAHRALRAIEDGARVFVTTELFALIEKCEICDDGECETCQARAEAAALVLEHSEDTADADEMAREGA